MFIGIQNNERIDINNYISGKVTCPVCGSDLITKRGEVNAHHFAHKTTTECDDWYEMSEWHRYWQGKFPEQYREIILNKDGVKHINDVKVNNLLIEFQHSPISVTNINKRNEFYTQFGTLVWLFDVKDIAKNIEMTTEDLLAWKWRNKSILMAADDNVHVYLQKSNQEIFRIDYFKLEDAYISKLDEDGFMNDLRKLFKGIDPRKESKFTYDDNVYKAGNKDIGFGKYRNNTIRYVYENNKQYLKWIFQNYDKQSLKDDIETYIKLLITNEEVLKKELDWLNEPKPVKKEIQQVVVKPLVVQEPIVNIKPKQIIIEEEKPEISMEEFLKIIGDESN